MSIKSDLSQVRESVSTFWKQEIYIYSIWKSKRKRRDISFYPYPLKAIRGGPGQKIHQGFPFEHFGGGDKIHPPLEQVGGGGKYTPIFGGGKHNFTNLKGKNT